jgi:hypothetical protein
VVPKEKVWAGAFLFDEKIRQSAALIFFGLRDVGLLYCNQKNNLCHIIAV